MKNKFQFPLKFIGFRVMIPIKDDIKTTIGIIDNLTINDFVFFFENPICLYLRGKNDIKASSRSQSKFLISVE